MAVVMSERLKSGLLLVVVIGLVALLPVLATMQYRWLGQLSSNEATRMQTNLDASVQRFKEEVNRILEDAERTFRLNPVYSPNVLAAELRASYQAWRATSDYPDLIEDVFWVRYDASFQPRLYHMDNAAGRLSPQIWPEELESWRKYYTEFGANYHKRNNRTSRGTIFIAANNPSPEQPRHPLGLSIFLLADDVPRFFQSPSRAAARGLQTSFIFLRLNEAYLTDWVFPNLTQTYFSDGDRLDYDLMLVEHEVPSDVFYRSTSSLDVSDFASADAEADIGGHKEMGFAVLNSLQTTPSAIRVIATDSLTSNFAVHFAQSDYNSPFESAFDVSFSDTSRVAGLLNRTRSFIATTDTTIDLHAPETSSYLFTDSLRITVNAIMRSPRRTTNLIGNFSETKHARWTLFVKHKAGSLQAAVTQSRVRNLAISFGILVLLGGATVLIFVSSQRAKRFAAQQVEFVAGVSHELRTPLAVIRSAAENLSDGVIRTPEQAKKYGALINKEGRRLSEMVEQILELAGAQSGKHTYVMQPVSVTTLVEEALAQCKPALDEGGFDVQVHIAQNLPMLNADQRALEGALRNLIRNAIKYSATGRFLRVQATLTRTRTATSVRISIEDRGRGIPADEIPHLFEPFFRGRDVRADQIHGNGLGLSLVHRTLKAHGGRIEVRSNVGVGSTFILFLPVSSPPSA